MFYDNQNSQKINEKWVFYQKIFQLQNIAKN